MGVAVLLVALVLPVGAQEPGDGTPALADCWAALREGDPEVALELADAALQEASAQEGEPTWLSEAYLARAAGLYALGRTRDAAVAARSVSDLEAAMSGIDDATLPVGFAAWVRAASHATAGPAPEPEIELSELNPEREIREVSSHFELDVEIVRIPVIVEDREGAFLTGLEAEHFTVVDGAPPARPIYQMIHENEPSSVGILVDGSDAAREQTPAIIQAVMQLIGQLRPEDEVFLLEFGDEPEFLRDLAPGGDDVLGALAAYEAGGGRALNDAVATGLIRLRRATFDKKSLVVISMGDDTGSETDADSVRMAAQRDGVSIHTILPEVGLGRWRPGQEHDEPTFLVQRVAFETGGLVALRAASSDNYGGLPAWIEQAARAVGSYIRHQYLLQYESVNPPPPGEWRPLRVHVSALHERVRARSGYVR